MAKSLEPNEGMRLNVRYVPFVRREHNHPQKNIISRVMVHVYRFGVYGYRFDWWMVRCFVSRDVEYNLRRYRTQVQYQYCTFYLNGEYDRPK